MLTRPVTEEEITKVLGKAWEMLYLTFKEGSTYDRQIRGTMDLINELNINIRVRGIDDKSTETR